MITWYFVVGETVYLPSSAYDAHISLQDRRLIAENAFTYRRQLLWIFSERATFLTPYEVSP